MRLLTFDYETHLIKSAYRVDGKKKKLKRVCGHNIAPKGVCVAWCDGEKSGLLLAGDAAPFLARAMEDPNTHFLGHNVAFDFGILAADSPDTLPLIRTIYRQGRVWDTKVRQQLIDIARGELTSEGKIGFRIMPDGARVSAKLDLATLTKLWCDRELAKEDTWRLRYSELDGVSLEEWPEDAKTYPLEDVRATLDVYQAQERWLALRRHPFNNGELPNQSEQCKKAWAAQRTSMWGLRTDAASVADLRKVLETEQAAVHAELSTTGIFREDGTRDMAVIQNKIVAGFASRGAKPPLTPTGRPETSEEAMIESGEPDLLALAKSISGGKLLSTYVPMLEAGTKYPICTSYGMAASGRFTSREPNVQNQPRKGGARECFVPRKNNVFVTVDFDTAELRSLAEVCLAKVKFSKLAEAFQRGADPHLTLAASMLRKPEAEVVAGYKAGDKKIEEARQFSKIPNFGYPGGLGAKSFVEYAKGYGYDIDLGKAERARQDWFNTWPEMELYFQWVNTRIRTGGVIEQLYSRRIRGGLSFPDAANGMFQSLTADGATDALYELWEACDEARIGDALHGVKPVVFIHDEIIAEIPYESPSQAHAAAEKMADVMRTTMQKWIPNVPAKCGAVMMRKWYKGARACYENGLLVPSKPHVEGDRTLWLPDHN